MKRGFLHGVFSSLLVVAMGFATNANATIIFEENFDAENNGNAQLNYTGFSQWTVGGGAVDLIGNSVFDFQKGNGLYLDMDGSSWDAGYIYSTWSLAAGSYTLSFDLAGNHRNYASETTYVSVGEWTGNFAATSIFNTYSLSKQEDFQRFSIGFSVLGGVSSSDYFIKFGGEGGDNIGMLLDNISLELKDDIAVTKVPEPNSIAFIAVGLISLGLIRRRKTI